MLTPQAVSTAAATLAIIVWAQHASAQAAVQIPVRFDYLSPGARSLGMGGAFIGASDDASTAYANPAGLTKISTREISLECRYRGMEMAFLQSGRLNGTTTGTGVDTTNGPTYGTDKSGSWAPGFMSFVLPLGNVTMGVYRHESVSMESSFAYSGALLRSGSGSDVREQPLTGEREMTVRSYGGAVGGKLHDRFAVGVGLSLYTFGLETEISQYTLQSNPYSAVNWDLITATARQDSWAASWGANVGALWSVSSDISIGAQWRRGPGFTLSQDDYTSSGTSDLLRSGTFKIPAAAGAGVQWQPTPSLRLVADYDWVQYSQIRRDLVSLDPSISGRGDQLRTDDGHEVHGGMEYLVLSVTKPLAFRAGAWYDPAHTVWYERTAANDPTDVLLSAALPKGKSLVHYTGGFGIALSGKSELNVGLDVSSKSTYMTASGVIRF
jgi:long-subunit fatty acid transport protein